MYVSWAFFQQILFKQNKASRTKSFHRSFEISARTYSEVFPPSDRTYSTPIHPLKGAFSWVTEYLNHGSHPLVHPTVMEFKLNPHFGRQCPRVAEMMDDLNLLLHERFTSLREPYIQGNRMKQSEGYMAWISRLIVYGSGNRGGEDELLLNVI